MPTMENFNHSVNRAFLPLLTLFIWLMPQLVSGQTAIQTQSVPGIMPTLAGPSKPRITPWDEECTTRGLIRPWILYSSCTNSVILDQFWSKSCVPYVTRTLKENDASDAVGVLTDCLCPAHKSIARVCLSLVCPSQAENLYTKQLLEGVCPGISAVVNFSYPFQTSATTTAEGTTTATSRGSGPDGAAGALRVPVAFPIVAVAVGLFLPLL
ncbi:uncharacterized protein CCOS01_03236 [Colletotrichum costaricense]|uniref:Uncharacterized protein n=1 Tax=Colletotrichum costaricense TaxID=1209916 RepID=A0AAI9Z4Z1_9PEZI|nr:uncharacterized protein CCOS01_03236 [Colletotrichum costaricense]KAK1534484.1 hypothetical protein CCOS01_03236 [Colletotrichum costaricense]